MSPHKKYEVKIMPHAGRSFKRLKRNHDLILRIDRAIQSLAENPRPPDCMELKSSKRDNQYRLRVSDWRILYAIDEEALIILILEVIRRNHAYVDL
jgi:mRNA interferase RelE/StbE